MSNFLAPARSPWRRVAALAGALMLAAGLVGCAGSPSTRFYTLSAAAPPARAAPMAGAARVVAIGPVALPDYIDRPQIVTRESAYAVKLAPFDQWAGPLTDMVPRVLVENIGLALPGDRVVGFPQVSGSGFDTRVSVGIDRFDVDAASTATLIARWQVYTRSAARPVVVADEVFVRPSSGQGYEAYAAAMSGTLADLAGAIAEDVAGAAGAPPPVPTAATGSPGTRRF